jgi:hypothetical protein
MNNSLTMLQGSATFNPTASTPDPRGERRCNLEQRATEQPQGNFPAQISALHVEPSGNPGEMSRGLLLRDWISADVSNHLAHIESSPVVKAHNIPTVCPSATQIGRFCFGVVAGKQASFCSCRTPLRVDIGALLM